MSSDKEVLFVRKASGLVRTIGPLTTAAITFGYLTQGIVYYPSFTALWFPGANLPLSYALGLPAMIFPLFVAIFFTAAMPRSASDYVAVSRIMSPHLAFVGTFLQWQNWVWVFGGFSAGGLQIFGPFLTFLGKTTHNDALVAAAAPFANYGTVELLLLGVLGLLLMMGLTIIGMKWSGYVLTAMFIGQLVGVVLGTAMLGYYATLGPAATARAWDNTYGVGAWQEVVDAATKHGWNEYVISMTGSTANWGWPGGWSWSQTLPAVIPAAYSWWGMELSNQVAGEIKEPSKTYTYGILLSAVIALVWYMATTIWISQAFGPFFLQYTYVDIKYPSALAKTPAIFPYTFVMEAPLFGNTWLGATQMLLQDLSLMSGGLAMLVVCSRVTFAWSYDRVFPQAFSTVDDRFRAPYWSIIAITMIGMIFWYVSNYHPYLVAANTYALAAMRYIFMGWAAMVFPWKLKDIYEHGFTTKIGKLPLVSLFGALATIGASWLLIQNVALLAYDMTSLTYQVCILALGAIIFAAYYAYRKSKGIDMDALYREIPPA